MPKTYHYVKRTRSWLDDEDIQYLILVLEILNTNSVAHDYLVDWAWAGEGGDPYAIDGVQDSFSLDPLGLKRITKRLQRTPPINIGQTVIDKIIADAKVTVNATEYIKEVQFIPTIFRRMPEYQLWNFDDGTFQGWTQDQGSLTTEKYHSTPYSIKESLGGYGDARLIYRNFNFTKVKNAVLKWWGTCTSAITPQIRLYDVDKEELILDWTDVGGNYPIAPTWEQRQFDLTNYVKDKNVRVDMGIKNTHSSTWVGYLDDVELEITY